jgi:type VI protein secretion system component VasF
MEQMETLVAKLSSTNENELDCSELLALSPTDASTITVPTKNRNIMSALFSEMPRVQRSLRESGTSAENMPSLRSILATMTDDEACVPPFPPPHTPSHTHS